MYYLSQRIKVLALCFVMQFRQQTSTGTSKTALHCAEAQAWHVWCTTACQRAQTINHAISSKLRMHTDDQTDVGIKCKSRDLPLGSDCAYTVVLLQSLAAIALPALCCTLSCWD